MDTRGDRKKTCETKTQDEGCRLRRGALLGGSERIRCHRGGAFVLLERGAAAVAFSGFAGTVALRAWDGFFVAPGQFYAMRQTGRSAVRTVVELPERSSAPPGASVLAYAVIRADAGGKRAEALRALARCAETERVSPAEENTLAEMADALERERMRDVDDSRAALCRAYAEVWRRIEGHDADIGLEHGRLVDALGIPPDLAREAFATFHPLGRKRILLESRLSRAKRLLETGTPPKSVWCACAFASPGTFSRQFSAKFGLSPRAFVRALRG